MMEKMGKGEERDIEVGPWNKMGIRMEVKM